MEALQSVYVNWGTEQIEFLQNVRTPLFDSFAAWLTRLGEAPLLIMLALGVLVFRRSGRDLAFWLIAAFLIASGTNALLKDALSVPRPDATEIWAATERHGSSTPSAHTMIAASVWMLAALSWGGKTRWLLLAVPFVVGVTRVYLGAHYPGDVILGLAFGAAIAFSLHAARSWVNGTIFADDGPLQQARLTAARLATATLALLTVRA
jgi:membrane-associated phospholipid phosphatase